MDRHPLPRLLNYMRPHRAQIIFATLFSVLNKLFDLAPPFLIGMAVDVVVEGQDSLVARVFGIEDKFEQLLVLCVLNAIVWIAESAFEYALKVYWRGLAQTVQHEARVDAFKHVQTLDMRWFEDQSTGGLLAVLSDDVNQLERFLDRGANDLLQTATTVIAVGASFFVLAPEVAPWAFVPIPFIVWGSFRFQRRLEPLYQKVRARAGDLAASLSNDLGGIATIKAFHTEDLEAGRIEVESKRYWEANQDAIRVSSAFVPLIRMAILVGFSVSLVYGGKLVLDGDLAVGSYSVMVYITQRLLWPLTRLGETFDLYQRAMASTRRILDLMAEKAQILPGKTRLDNVRGEIRFDDVVFAYGDAEDEADGQKATPRVLDGLSLSIPKGQTHAVVGSTGSGKSTLVKTLLRLHDVQSGSVRIDGVDVRELDFESLRGNIGLVAQDVFLFHGTVRQNIAYGQAEASDADIINAARLAEALEFIEAMPNGFDTIVGERGQKLSGGQRQRISLARAILRDPAILVLDEATSAVDNETEASIQRSLERVTQNRSTLVIAHRLSTVRNAHKIHVLHKGRVVESGTHDELLEKGGQYAVLWQVQTGQALAVK